jgi:phosphoserine phosphatase
MHSRRGSQRVVAEPGSLAFRVLPRDENGARGGGRQIERAREVGGKLGHTVGAQRGQAGIEPEREQRLHLGERPGGEHCNEPTRDRLAQRSPERIEQDRNEAPRVGRLMASRLPGDQASAGRKPDFEGTGKALGVGRSEPHGGRRIDFGKVGVQPNRAKGGEQGAGFSPRPGRDLGNFRKPVDQGRKIEPAASAEDRQTARTMSLLHGGECRFAPPGRGGGFGGRPHTIEAVRHTRFLFGRRPGGEDAKLAIKLHGVGIDDRAAEPFGEDCGKRRFARCGGAGDDDGSAGIGVGVGLRLAWFRPRCQGQRRIRMTHMLTLIADRRAGLLSGTVVARVREALGGNAPSVLSPDEAVEIACAEAPDLACVRTVLEGTAIDAIATEATGRRKKLLLADMDSTIVTAETLDELAAYAGLKAEVAEITRAGMNGEIDFREGLRRRVAMLKGLSVSALEETWRALGFTPGARALVATMRKHGAMTALVSGGFTWFTGRVATALGFHVHRANVLVHDGRVLSGAVEEPILDRDAKLATLEELAAEEGLPLSATLAVGDGANDLPMLAAAGLGIAFHPKPLVAASARARIDFCDLRAALFAQGFHATEIVEG